MRALGNLYPWEDGDPAAADRIAGIGPAGVVLAAACHTVRAVTPRHPRHRIVTRDAAVCYRPDPARWLSCRLRPAVAPPDGSSGRAAERLRRAGLQVTARVVLHGGAHGKTAGTTAAPGRRGRPGTGGAVP